MNVPLPTSIFTIHVSILVLISLNHSWKVQVAGIELGICHFFCDLTCFENARSKCCIFHHELVWCVNMLFMGVCVLFSNQSTDRPAGLQCGVG